METTPLDTQVLAGLDARASTGRHEAVTCLMTLEELRALPEEELGDLLCSADLAMEQPHTATPGGK